VHGGRAIPDRRCFNKDGLHLSDEGYEVWERRVEKEILHVANCS
jgi:lysophospholipase L1-like esterase